MTSTPRSFLTYSIDPVSVLVSRDMKLRYQRSLLGMFWSLITPLSQLVVFMFLSHSILNLNIPNYPLFVFSGVLAWSWFQSSLFLSADAITGNRPLIRRPGFPSALLPVVTVTTNFIHYLIALPVLLLFIVVSGIPLTSALLAFPLVLAVQFVLILSLAYLIATLQVTIRDTQHVLSIVLLILFYITPVFYAADRVPPQYRFVFELNPMAHLIGATRDVLVMGVWPDMRALAVIGIASMLMLAFGYTIFQRASNYFVEEL